VWRQLALGACGCPCVSATTASLEAGRPTVKASRPSPPLAMRLGLHRNAPRGAPHHRLPVKARSGDDTLFARLATSALVEVMDARVGYRCSCTEEMSPMSCFATKPSQRAPGSCCDSRPAGGRTHSLRDELFSRCACGRHTVDLAGGDTPWPAGRTRVTVQSGYTADRVWGSRYMTGGPG
jgi:hypothetical protein